MPTPPKFFDWYDLERIFKSVGQEAPEREREFLAWLRTNHLVVLNFWHVYLRSQEKLNFSPRSKLGHTAYQTVRGMRDELNRLVDMFPQSEIEKLLETLEEAAEPV